MPPTAANPEKEAAYGALQSGYKQEAEAGVGAQLGPQAQADYKDANQQLGDSINLNIRKAAGKATDRFEAADALTPDDIKFALLPGAFGAGLNGATTEKGITLLAVKKMIDALHATSAKTGLGLLGNRVFGSAAAPVLDAAARQGGVSVYRNAQQPGPYVIPAGGDQ